MGVYFGGSLGVPDNRDCVSIRLRDTLVDLEMIWNPAHVSTASHAATAPVHTRMPKKDPHFGSVRVVGGLVGGTSGGWGSHGVSFLGLWNVADAVGTPDFRRDARAGRGAGCPKSTQILQNPLKYTQLHGRRPRRQGGVKAPS